MEDEDLKVIRKALEAKRKPDEKELKEMSQVTRLYFGLWESLIVDSYDLIRLKVQFKNVPFQSVREVLVLPRSLVREIVLTAHQQMAHTHTNTERFIIPLFNSLNLFL